MVAVNKTMDFYLEKFSTKK